MMSEDKDALWFLERLPSTSELNVIRNAGVDGLVRVAADRAIVGPTQGPVRREGADPKAVKAAMAMALAAADKLTQLGDQAILSADEKAALELFILVVSRPALFVVDHRVSGRSDLW